MCRASPRRFRRPPVHGRLALCSVRLAPILCRSGTPKPAPGGKTPMPTRTPSNPLEVPHTVLPFEEAPSTTTEPAAYNSGRDDQTAPARARGGRGQRRDRRAATHPILCSAARKIVKPNVAAEIPRSTSSALKRPRLCRSPSNRLSGAPQKAEDQQQHCVVDCPGVAMGLPRRLYQACLCTYHSNIGYPRRALRATRSGKIVLPGLGQPLLTGEERR